MAAAAPGAGPPPTEAVLQSEGPCLALSGFLREAACGRLRCAARWCLSPEAVPGTHRALATRRSICRLFALVEVALRSDAKGNHVHSGPAPRVRLEDLRARVLARTAGAEELDDRRLGQVLAMAGGTIQVLEPQQGEVVLALRVGGEERVPSTAELAARCRCFEAAVASITEELAVGQVPCLPVPSTAPSGAGPRRKLKRTYSCSEKWAVPNPVQWELLGPRAAKYETNRQQLEVAELAERAVCGAELACDVVEEFLESSGGRVDEERLFKEVQKRASSLKLQPRARISTLGRPHDKKEARAWISTLVAFVEAEGLEWFSVVDAAKRTPASSKTVLQKGAGSATTHPGAALRAQASALQARTQTLTRQVHGALVGSIPTEGPGPPEPPRAPREAAPQVQAALAGPMPTEGPAPPEPPRARRSAHASCSHSGDVAMAAAAPLGAPRGAGPPEPPDGARREAAPAEPPKRRRRLAAAGAGAAGPGPLRPWLLALAQPAPPLRSAAEDQRSWLLEALEGPGQAS